MKAKQWKGKQGRESCSYCVENKFFSFSFLILFYLSNIPKSLYGTCFPKSCSRFLWFSQEAKLKKKDLMLIVFTVLLSSMNACWFVFTDNAWNNSYQDLRVTINVTFPTCFLAVFTIVTACTNTYLPLRYIYGPSPWWTSFLSTTFIVH